MFRVNCVERDDCKEIVISEEDRVVRFYYTDELESMVFNVPFEDIKNASDEWENLIVQGDNYWLYLDVNDCDEIKEGVL